MARIVPISLGFVLIVFLAVVQGRWSDRWTDTSEAAQQLAARLENVPTQFGSWKVKSDSSETLDDRTREVAGAVGHLSRVYENEKTGDEVSVYLVCGHSRKITGHTPDKCYPASGFKGISREMKHSISLGENSAEFFTNSYRKATPEGNQVLRVFWSWADDNPGQRGQWVAPDQPWRAFAFVPAMYKMYLISPIRKRKERPHESPCVNFAEEFIPRLNQQLFPDADQPTSEPA